MKNLILAFCILLAVIGGLYFFSRWFRDDGEEGEPDMQGLEFIDVRGEAATSSRLQIAVVKGGEGPEAKTGDVVSVHYTGALEDGTVFDSSLTRGEPFMFQLGASTVIQGWEEGVLGMKAGEKRQLIIPPELAYGDQGVPGAIPGGAILMFEVELLEIH